MNGENSDNRRKFQRVLFDADTRVEAASGSATARLKDLSLKGVLIQHPAQWTCAIGDEVSITIQLDKAEEFIIRMQTRVAHIEQDHIGLRCELIDLDSITHLRRLLELNLGDPDLLQRELAALG